MPIHLLLCCRLRDTEQRRYERQRELIQHRQHEELQHQQRLLQQQHDDAMASLQREQDVTAAIKTAALDRARRLDEENEDLANRKAHFDQQIEEVSL